MMKDLLIGASYIVFGFRYLLHPKLRKFVLLPLLINIVVFIAAFYWGYDILSAKLQSIQAGDLPNWLSWMQSFFDWIMAGIKWLLTLIWIILFVFVFSFIGSLSANFIASPFNGLLCEKMDHHINHFAPTDRPILKTIALSLLREVYKWLYYLPRLILIGLLCLVLYFIPIVNILATALFYLFGAWMLAFEYLDFPADNRHSNINDLKKRLQSKKMLTFGFGLSVFSLTLVPFVNFIILPLATLSATKLWADHFSQIQIEGKK